MGASRKDVPGQGGGGGISPKGTKYSNLYSNNDVIGGTKGGRGSKSPDFEGTSFMDAP